MNRSDTIGQFTSQAIQLLGYKNISVRDRITISERSDQIFNDLKFFSSVGKAWQRLISDFFDYRYQSILEVGCGHFSKIGIGLIYSQFLGKLSLLDLDSKACTRAMRSLEYFGARFNCRPEVSSIFSESRKRYDVILANNFIDNMVLTAFCECSGDSLVDLQEDNSLYYKVWAQIMERPIFVQELIAKLAQVLNQRCNSGGLIVFMDYPSYSSRSAEFKSLIRFIRSIQDQLRESLRMLRNEELFLPKNRVVKSERLKITRSDLVAFRKRT